MGSRQAVGCRDRELNMISVTSRIFTVTFLPNEEVHEVHATGRINFVS